MDSEHEKLSPRQKQLAKLLSEGLSNKEIAWYLGLTEGTVKVYLSSMYKRLGIHGRVNIANWVRDVWERAA